MEEIFSVKCEDCGRVFESNSIGRKFCSSCDPYTRGRDVDTKGAPIVLPVQTRDRDVAGVDVAKSDNPPSGDNIRKLNEVYRKLGSAIGLGKVSGRDQPEAKKFREANPSGHWEGDVWVVPFVNPWFSVFVGPKSGKQAPTSQEWDRLVDAFEDGQLEKHPEYVKVFIKQRGVNEYENILRILTERSETRRRQLADDKRPKAKAIQESLHEAYVRYGLEDVPLTCKHLLNSKLSPQIPRIMLGAKTAYCPECGVETDRSVIVKWMEEKLHGK